jgi:tRNA threonylcarbamoyl adenosine modification protein YeaZ
VAVVSDQVVLATTAHSDGEEYSSWLLPAVERTLTVASRTMADLDLYAVASGPGSFTGVRIGLTTVKAWAEVYGKPIAAASRLEVVARQFSGEASYIASFIYAQRGQIFGALYRRCESAFALVEEEMVTTPLAFLTWVVEQVGFEADAPAGPEVRNVGWISTDPSLLVELSETASPRGMPAHRPTNVQGLAAVLAPMIGKLGIQKAQRGEVLDALTLDANYVRRSYVEVFQKK